MFKYLILLVLMFALSGYGKGVEQYIPIGQSPGVSGKLSYRGKVASEAFVEGGSVYFRLEGTESRFVQVPITTPVYIDNSACRQPSKVGKWTDVKEGKYAEVYAPKKEIGWVKVKGCIGDGDVHAN